jgi:hypothetical protein
MLSYWAHLHKHLFSDMVPTCTCFNVPLPLLISGCNAHIMINVDFIFVERSLASIRDDQRSESDILASINGIVLSKFIWCAVFYVTETVLYHFKNF